MLLASLVFEKYSLVDLLMSACNENSPIFSKCIGFIFFFKCCNTVHVVSGYKISHSAGVIRRSVKAFLLPVLIMCAQIPGI